MSDLNKLIKQKKINQVKKFWGQYEFLNNPLGDLSDNILFNLQKSRLSILENSSSPQLKTTNEFLESLKKMSYENEVTEKILDYSSNQIYQRIMELINSGLFSSNLNPTGSAIRNNTYEQDKASGKIQQDALRIEQELNSLLKLINYANANQLTTNLMKAFNGKKIDGYSSYVQYKAIEAEKLMTHFLSQNPSWKAIQTGQFFNQGQQLLQDAFVFDNRVLSIDFGSNLSFTIKTDNKKETKNVRNLEEFFQLYENLSGNFSISLSDELYNKFLEISIMTAQAKSGYHLQSLLNQTSKRNAISLNTLGPTSSLIGLMKLYNSNWIDPQAESKSLISITNYCLSKSIALTNITGNSIYFTRDGFITASRWMDLYNQMLKFNPDIKKVSANLLDAKNPYAFKNVT